MKVSGLTFYLLHVKVMKFSEIMQDLMSSHGHTILTFMPVDFFHIPNGGFVEDNELSRLSKISIINHVIAEVLKPLAETVISGLNAVLVTMKWSGYT